MELKVLIIKYLISQQEKKDTFSKFLDKVKPFPTCSPESCSNQTDSTKCILNVLCSTFVLKWSSLDFSIKLEIYSNDIIKCSN